MTITSLMDDLCPRRGLRGEHGLSFYIEKGSTRLLFDTGQTEAFRENARVLGIPLHTLDAVVLSHGHYDHGGGLSILSTAEGKSPIRFYAGRGFDDRRWTAEAEGLRDIGLDRRMLLDLGTRMRGVETRIVETTIEIADDLFLMSCAEMRSDAHIDTRFRRGAAETTRPDLFEDELSLVSVEEGSLSIVTGCAHRGILNIVEAARTAFPRLPIRAIVGGFHLASLPAAVLAGIAEDLAAIGPAAVYPAHCTGVRGFAALDSVFRGKATWLSCGMRIQL